MKRKIVSLLIVLMLLLSCFSFSYADQDGIGIYIDGVKLETTAAPININGNVMVPMRDIFEAMGATVEWIHEEGRVDARKGLKLVQMYVSNAIDDPGVMLINEKQVPTRMASKLIDGKTFVPARAVAESFDATVEWVDGNVIITSEKDGYDEFPYVPDFGKMFNVELHKNTINEFTAENITRSSVMYYYQKDKFPKDAMDKYLDDIYDLGFVFLMSNANDSSQKVYYHYDKNVYVVLYSQQNAHVITIMVPVSLETLNPKAKN